MYACALHTYMNCIEHAVHWKKKNKIKQHPTWYLNQPYTESIDSDINVSETRYRDKNIAVHSANIYAPQWNPSKFNCHRIRLKRHLCVNVRCQHIHNQDRDYFNLYNIRENRELLFFDRCNFLLVFHSSELHEMITK